MEWWELYLQIRSSLKSFYICKKKIIIKSNVVFDIEQTEDLIQPI